MRGEWDEFVVVCKDGLKACVVGSEEQAWPAWQVWLGGACQGGILRHCRFKKSRGAAPTSPLTT